MTLAIFPEAEVVEIQTRLLWLKAALIHVFIGSKANQLHIDLLVRHVVRMDNQRHPLRSETLWQVNVEYHRLSRWQRAEGVFVLGQFAVKNTGVHLGFRPSVGVFVKEKAEQFPTAPLRFMAAGKITVPRYFLRIRG